MKPRGARFTPRTRLLALMAGIVVAAGAVGGYVVLRWRAALRVRQAVAEVAVTVLKLEANIGASGQAGAPSVADSLQPLVPWIVPGSQADAVTRWWIRQDLAVQSPAGPRLKSVSVTLTAPPTVAVAGEEATVQLAFQWTRVVSGLGELTSSGTLKEWLVHGARGWQVKALLFQFPPSSVHDPEISQAAEQLWQLAPATPPPFGIPRAPALAPLPPDSSGP